MSRARAKQNGAQCTTSEIRQIQSMTGSLHWVTGGTRPDGKSVVEETINAPGVRSQARRTNCQALEGQPEIGLRFIPLPSKMCVLVYTDSALHNADADPDEEGSDDEWLAKAKQKGIRA